MRYMLSAPTASMVSESQPNLMTDFFSGLYVTLRIAIEVMIIAMSPVVAWALEISEKSGPPA